MLSVVINTKNAEKTLKQCLKSVKFADEIVVLDMQSDDQTVEIAKAAGARVFSTTDRGYVEPARNEVILKAKGQWIFVIDADEEISAELQSAIQKIVSQSQTEESSVAYRISRKNMIWGKWMKHTGWWPDYQLRLFMRGKVHWKNEIHSIPEVKGKVVDLPADESLALIHHNYTSIGEFIQRLDRYSTIQSTEVKTKRPLSTTEVIEIFFDEWLRRLFEWNGIKDGVRGQALSFLQSTSELVKVLKIWEKNGFRDKAQSDEEVIHSLEAVNNSLKYWLADWHVKNSSGLTQIFWKVRRKMMI